MLEEQYNQGFADAQASSTIDAPEGKSLAYYAGWNDGIKGVDINYDDAVKILKEEPDVKVQWLSDYAKPGEQKWIDVEPGTSDLVMLRDMGAKLRKLWNPSAFDRLSDEEQQSWMNKALNYKKNHGLKLNADEVIKLAADMFNAKDPGQIDEAYNNLGSIIKGIRATDFNPEEE